MQLHRDRPLFKQRNAEIVAISASNVDRIARFQERQGIDLKILADPNKLVLTSLGQEFRWLKFGRMPAVLIIDQQGVLRFSHFGKSARDIPENETLLAELDRIESELGSVQYPTYGSIHCR